MVLPRISVVVPSFNQASYLRQTLESVIAQRYPALDLIVVDGGSTDGSLEILREYQQHFSWWVHEPDAGQTDALIKGFSHAQGDILCWLNSDDLFEPWTLAEVGRWFEEHPEAGAVFGDAVWIDERGQVLRAQREIPFNRFIWLHTFNYIPGMSMFWSKQVHDAAGGLNPRFNLGMDGDLWIRIADLAKIHHVRRVWSRSRFHAAQKTQRLNADSNREYQEIRARYLKQGAPSWMRAQRVAAYALRVAWKAATGCYSIGYERDLRVHAARVSRSK